MSWPNGTEIWILCKQLLMWQSFIILASVRKLPSVRFRTWPWNGEFFRRECLAAAGAFWSFGCRKERCMKSSKWIAKGAKRDHYWTKRVPNAIKMDPKRFPKNSKSDPKYNIESMSRKVQKHGSEKEGRRCRWVVSCWSTDWYRKTKKYYSKSIKKLVARKK